MKKILTTILLTTATTMTLLTGCGSSAGSDSTADAEGTYVFHVQDEEGNGVSGVKLQLCTEEHCQVIDTDADGVAVYDGQPEEMEVHVYKYPDGYTYDEDETYTTSKDSEEITFTLQTDSNAEDTSSTADSDANRANTDETQTETASASETATDRAATSETAADGTAASESTLQGTFPYVEKQMDVKPSDEQVKFSCTDINGNTLDDSIFKDYDVTLITMWEPYCDGCVEEMPSFQKAMEEAQKAGIKFNVIGFYTDEEDAEKVIKENNITFPVAKYEDIFKQFETGYVPTNVFVDSEGHVLPVTAEENTSLTEASLREALESYRNGEVQEELGEYYEDYKEAYEELDKADKEGTFDKIVEEYAGEYIYEKGQVNTLTEEYLYQYIANRLA